MTVTRAKVRGRLALPYPAQVSEPLFSIITPVYQPPPEVFERMLGSVRAQTFPRWELCLVDDAGEDSRVWELLERAARDDPRIHAHRGAERSGIAGASNAALALARGKFIALLDHDDELAPHALERMAASVEEDGRVDFLYSDEDKIDHRGRRFDQFVKPGWSPDRLRGQMYTSHLCVLRRSLVEEIGGFRSGFDGAQDWDLVLRASERARRVVRVPEILYHWRTLPASAASELDAKPWAHDASRRALADHLARVGIEATAESVPGYPGYYWLAPRADDRRAQPLVSVVIPTAGSTRRIAGSKRVLVCNCVESLLSRSTHESLEIVVVADEEVTEDVREELHELGGGRLRIIDYDGEFNFSAKINLGAREASGEFLLFLNDDVEVVPDGWRPSPKHALHPVPEWPLSRGGRRAWIEAMLVYARQPGVGAVGAKLYFPNGSLQHVGVALMGGAPGHPFYGVRGNTSGYFGNLVVASNYAAVTAACMMTTRAAFEAVGGFDESWPVNYNDVDFCLELRERGLRSVCVPWVELLHRESASRGKGSVAPAELEALRSKWGELLENDPFYDRRFAGGNFGMGAAAAAGSYVARARQLLGEGGPRLLAARSAGWLRRRIRERLGSR